MKLYKKAKKKLDGTWNEERELKRDKLYALRGFLETLFCGFESEEVRVIKEVIDKKLKDLLGR